MRQPSRIITPCNTFRIVYVIFVFVIMMLVSIDNINAQNPGDTCDPDLDTGRTARIISLNGSINIQSPDGQISNGEVGSLILHGSTIETGHNDSAILALEDGTNDRLSRLKVKPNTKTVLTGGLMCEDLRPKADKGRWWVREVGIELDKGDIEVEIAAGVSANFRKNVLTPNAEINLQRRREEKMVYRISSKGLEERNEIPLVKHPLILANLQYMFGMFSANSYEELQTREQESFRQQAVNIAMELNIVDIETDELLKNPQIGRVANSLTRGQKLDEMDEESRQQTLNMIVNLAVQQNLIDTETLMVYEHPDKYTYVEVEKGKLRVRNRIKNHGREQTVTVEDGESVGIKGFWLVD